MATNNTGSARRPFGEVDRVGPISEGDFKSDVFALVASVRAMAGNAGASLFHVDVKVVQVVLAVPEIGQGGGVFLLGDILVVASKTEIVLAWLVFAVEIAREVAD